MKQEIGFGLIDAKDSEIIDIDGHRPRNIHNAKIMAKAEASYLNGLLKLQENVRNLYGSELIENKPVEGEPENEWEIQDIGHKMDPLLLEKGTSNLWYS